MRRYHEGQVIDGFRLEEPLHQGGMATLWRVTHPHHRKPLLMKTPIIDPDEGPGSIVGFEVEHMVLPRLALSPAERPGRNAAAALRLRHPALPTLSPRNRRRPPGWRAEPTLSAARTSGDRPASWLEYCIGARKLTAPNGAT